MGCSGLLLAVRLSWAFLNILPKLSWAVLGCHLLSAVLACLALSSAVLRCLGLYWAVTGVFWARCCPWSVFGCPVLLLAWGSQVVLTRVGLSVLGPLGCCAVLG